MKKIKQYQNRIYSLYKQLKWVIFISLIIRLGFWAYVTVFNIPTGLTEQETAEYLAMETPPDRVQLADMSDYSLTVENDMVPPESIRTFWGYDKWYERQALHTLVLYLTRNCILFQILFSVITVALLYRIEKIAGWMYAFYPVSVIYSVTTGKITLMVMLMVICYYLFQGRWLYLIASFLLIQLFFSSIFNFSPHSPGIMEEFNRGSIDKVVNLWQPTLNHVHIIAGKWVIYVNALPYLVIMFLFFRRSFITNPVFVIVVIISIGAGLQYAHEFHREFIMPLILIETLKTLK